MTTRADFDSNGKFAKGNQVAKGNGHPCLRRLMELRQEFLQSISTERMKRIEEEVFKLATEEPDPRVRLAACVEWLNRVLGKSDQNINVQAESRALTVHANVSPEEQAVLEAVIARQRAALPAAPVALPAAQ